MTTTEFQTGVYAPGMLIWPKKGTPIYLLVYKVGEITQF